MSASPCAACGFANPAGALFCGSCGTALGRPCPSCGTVVSPGLSFCTSCGFALEEAGAPPTSEERKVVTVVFVDLVGFTGRAESLDPEDVRGLLAPYHMRAKTELERFGGTVEKFIGDAVMAVFGAPVAHEDDPERAVRAALAVREGIADLNAADPSLQLSVRIGAATGEALVDLNARPEEGEALAAGDVLNTASRLQSAAPADEVLVDAATQRATEHAIQYEDAEPIVAKGKSDPVPVWKAVAPRARLGVDIAFRGGAPLVGRDAELRALLDAVARMRAERSAQLVTLVGEPGIGKSRLVYELWAALEIDPELTAWRQGRSLPYGEGVSYWALGEMVKAQAGILESDDAGVAEAKLHAAVENVVADPADAEWIDGHLRPLIGLAPAGETGSDHATETLGAWRRFFEAMAEQRPLVLVFEDLHWADDGLLDFVDGIVDWATDIPLLVLCTARPELLDSRPGWGGGKRNATTLSLSPLSPEETGSLVTSLLSNGRLLDERRSELLLRAGGNPLYAEEYVRMLSLAEEDLPLPESVQGIIAARLDTLPPPEKALVQGASIVGKVFWPGALADVLGQERADVEQSLQILDRKEFVRRERRSSVAGETAYVFRHALVRDVAYSQIPRKRRAEMHRLAAGWIETLAGDRSEDLADLVAHHYLSALDLGRRTGREDPGLAGRARVALMEAGDRSYALNAFAAAARFYEQALALSTETEPERARVLLGYGRALFHAEGTGKDALREAADSFLDAGDREQAALALLALADFVHFIEGNTPEASANLDLAVSLVADSEASPIKAGVLANRARFHMIADETDRAIPLADEALALATSLGLEDLQAHTLNTRGVARTMSGDLGGVDDLERAVEIAPPLSFELLRALNNLVSTLVELGELERGFALMARSLEAARRHGHVVAMAWVETQELDRLYWIGAWDELLARSEAMLDGTSTPTLMGIDAYIFRARLRIARDEVAGALEDSAKLLELARVQGDPQVAFPALATRAEVLHESGQEEEAVVALEDLLTRWRESPSSAAGPWVAELARALDGLGRGAELFEASSQVRLRTSWLEAAETLAAGDAVRAADLYDEIGAQSDAAKTRLLAAQQLVSADRREEAEEQLELALEFFRRAGATRFVREAEALLAVS
jgi:class 3 adenylate cyclase/tetratricopeptide (TPR) repeat protein